MAESNKMKEMPVNKLKKKRRHLRHIFIFHHAPVSLQKLFYLLLILLCKGRKFI